MANEEYESVIGLEVHAQLSTASKIFCGCANQFGAEPNSVTCPVCLGLPGALPALNRKAVEYALRMVVSVNGKINLLSEFARKNYFYPDLPKGYQITQYDKPIGEGGAIDIEIDGVVRSIQLRRIHLEEDAGKLLHPENDTGYTLIDYNRCGTPLAEIVTEPAIHSPKEARLYLLKLKQLLRYLEICSGDMEKGALRCDANVSVRRKGSGKMGVKTEVKNLNSFKAVEKALEYEINRQTGLIEKGESISHETLLWDEVKQECRVMRSKEESADYRYFPEPDLPPLALDKKWIEEIQKSLPELPDAKMKRFRERYGLSAYESSLLCSEKSISLFYENIVDGYHNYKNAANWVLGEVFREMKERSADINGLKISAESLRELLVSIDNDEISLSSARIVFAEMAETGKSAREIIHAKDLAQVSDRGEIESMVKRVLRENPAQLEQYLNGRDKVYGYFVGQVMRISGGRANPGVVNNILKKALNEIKDRKDE